MTFDRIDDWMDKAMGAYCEMNEKEPSELTEEDYKELQYYAGNHIGFFLAWIIKHDFIGEVHKDEYDKEAVEAVKNEKMSGVEFVIQYCDGKFWDEDVSDEILPFVKKYYKNYMGDYIDWVLEELCDIPLEFIGTWEDYHNFEHILDEAYQNYCA